jgi:hypothetical protein
VERDENHTWCDTVGDAGSQLDLAAPAANSHSRIASQPDTLGIVRMQLNVGLGHFVVQLFRAP